MKKIFVVIVFLTAVNLCAKELGVYTKTNIKVTGTIEEVSKKIENSFVEHGFNILFNDFVKSPDFVREDSSEFCGYKAKLIVITSKDYVDFLTSYGNKYLVASFLRIGIYEGENGISISIADPETINRIVFNDLYENDEVQKYVGLYKKSAEYKENIVSILHGLELGESVNEAMPPLRDVDDLAESSKDMFMMVGPLTFFTDDDQFPLIYSESAVSSSVQSVVAMIKENLSNFVPSQDDIEYRWAPNKDALKWRIISSNESSDNKAIVLGITRDRTEGVSFHIAGSSRESESNLCPGIDHAAAYPIEVLIIQEEDNINVYTQTEMIRMDMYFWDAGMSAFMDHMSMPGILDESIKKALLGSKYIEE